jgi:uncharacterized protein
MYSPDRPSPSPPLSRTSLVIGLYGAIALVGLLIAAGRGDPDVYGVTVSAPWQLLAGPAIGVAAGLFVVWLSRLASRYFAWARALHTAFKDLLGPLTEREILIVALASSIGEEALFRGALMPWLGLWAQAGLFALMHIGRDRRLVPWTLWAFGMGVGFGALAQWTGNLGAPIAAHFMINFLNLRFIVRTPAHRPAAENLLSPSAAA